MSMANNINKKMTTKKRFLAVLKVAKIAYQAAPLSVSVKIIDIFVSAVLPLVTTYFAALTTTALADAYAGDKSAGMRAIMYVIVTALLGVAMVGWSSLDQYINKLVRYKIDASINDQMYEHFLGLEFWRYDDKHTADLLDKAKQFSSFFGYIFNSLAGIATQFITVIASLIALLFVSWWLGLILIIAVIPGIVIQYKLSKAQINHWNSNIETRRVGYMIERSMLTINTIAELRLYGVVRHLLNLRMKLRETDEKGRIDFERKYIVKQLASDAIEATAEVIALLYTTFQIIAHAQPIGQFLFVQQVISRALGGVRSFVTQVNTIDEDIANLFDYQEFMELPISKVRPIKISRQPEVIDLQNVSFHYRGSRTYVLQDISLTIHRSTHIAIVGENGAGKSTLIKLILGLYNPTNGRILIDDNDLKLVDTETWHSYLGVLQQEFAKYSFASARDNVYFGDVSVKPDKKRFESALDRAEARTFLKKLPQGFDTFVDQWMENKDGTSGVDLSGGQWQRLALARNFYRDSPIIILDEPTSAIDALAESRIFNNLFSDKDRTVITISHRLTTVEKADVIYMLDNGRIVESGTHKQLINKKGAYYHMFESQLRENEK
jgi:ATP-binding cassette subfamily B protein/ATP-binding cassette subfamily C protein